MVIILAGGTGGHTNGIQTVVKSLLSRSIMIIDSKENLLLIIRAIDDGRLSVHQISVFTNMNANRVKTNLKFLVSMPDPAIKMLNKKSRNKIFNLTGADFNHAYFDNLAAKLDHEHSLSLMKPSTKKHPPSIKPIMQQTWFSGIL